MGNEASAPTTTAGGGDGRGPAGETSHEEKLRAIRQMDSTIRQRLRGGVSYNMKVVLRGERGSGKSALLARLQGQPFKPEVR
jgi:predicted ATP-dependent serine protease